MAVPINLRDAGSKSSANVNSFGVLAVGGVEFNEISAQEMDTINTAYNFYVPKYPKRLIINQMLITASRNVGASGSVVEIYEADGPDTLTVSKQLIKLDIPRSTVVPLSGMDLLITEGKWVNAKCDDNDIFISILGYYAPSRDNTGE